MVQKLVKCTCEHCKKEFEMNQILEIEDKEEVNTFLKIKDAVFMKSTCQHCNTENVVSHSLKYRNEEKKFEVLYSFDMNEIASYIKEENKEYTKRVFLNDYDSFVEDIYYLLNGLNEYVMVLYKMGLFQKFTENNRKVESIHFNGVDYEYQIFEAIVKDEYNRKEPRRVAFEKDFYNYLADSVKELSQRDPKQDYIINFKLINNILEGTETPLHLLEN